MKHERNFEMAEPDIEPYPHWIKALIWGFIWLFGMLFWLAMIGLAAATIPAR